MEFIFPLKKNLLLIHEYIRYVHTCISQNIIKTVLKSWNVKVKLKDGMSSHSPLYNFNNLSIIVQSKIVVILSTSTVFACRIDKSYSASLNFIGLGCADFLTDIEAPLGRLITDS